MRAYISKQADEIIKSRLSEMGYEIIEIDGGDIVYSAVSCHPDIFLCSLGDGIVFHGEISKIGHDYPKNICYNAVCLDKYFIHHLPYTDEALLEKAKETGRTLINVKQGYTKCSCVVVDGKSIITADRGIIKALSKYDDINVLEISEGSVLLPHMEVGFIGGASGATEDFVIFAGDITLHPDFEKIKAFIEARWKRIICFPGIPLTDIGTIIFEK